jgi:hypothetical protein
MSTWLPVVTLAIGGILGYGGAWWHFAILVDREPGRAISRLIRARESTVERCHTVLATGRYDRIATCVLYEGHGGPHATTIEELTAIGFTRPEF